MSRIEGWVRGDLEAAPQLEVRDDQRPAVRFRLSEIKRIIEQERRHQEFIQTPHFSQGENFSTVIGGEFNFRNYLLRLERLASRLRDQHETAVIRSFDKRGEMRVKLSRLGKTALTLICEQDPEILDFYRNHEFRPDLAVLLEATRKANSAIDWFTYGTPGFVPEIAEMLEEFVQEVRKELRSEEFRRRAKNHRRMERQNFKSCWNYVSWLFGRRSRLLFVRIDFYFRPFSKSWGSSVEAHKCHSKFLRALREDRVVGDVIGYISKREIGVDRGTHYHVIVAIDGHMHRDAAYLARTIGEFWVRVCGNSEVLALPRASYFNCYTLKDFYEFNCIGLVRINDWRMLKGLEIAIRYMCKETSHVRAGVFEVDANDGIPVRRLNVGKRNIIRGIKRAVAGKKRGAPRKLINQHDHEYQWG